MEASPPTRYQGVAAQFKGVRAIAHPFVLPELWF